MVYMLSLSKLGKAEKRHEMVLVVIFIIYILLDIQTPESLARLIDNIYGNIFVILIAITIFASTNPVVGIISFIAAYELIKRSRTTNFPPSEYSKLEDFSDYNAFPVTLEEQMVEQMAPLVKYDADPNLNYNPTLGSLHDAAPIDYEGVI